MPTLTHHSSIGLNNINTIPETVSELYYLELELNNHISNCLDDIYSSVSDAYKKTIKNLLYYQQVEKTKLIELLHNELNHCDRAFYDRRKNSITVYQSSSYDSAKANSFIKKSLDTFAERINNFDYICRGHKDLSEVDLLILYLGLRDYCANFYQQMAVNYNDKKMMAACKELVVLIDQISDDIGLAYTSQKQNNPG